jgi:hypothetical protein
MSKISEIALVVKVTGIEVDIPTNKQLMQMMQNIKAFNVYGDVDLLITAPPASKEHDKVFFWKTTPKNSESALKSYKNKGRGSNIAAMLAIHRASPKFAFKTPSLMVWKNPNSDEDLFMSIHRFSIIIGVCNDKTNFQYNLAGVDLSKPR